MRRYLRLLATIVSLCAAPAAAETWSQVYNGGTCNPYPSQGDNFAGLNYSFWLYGFRNTAFCHFEIPDGWDAEDLSYAVFVGSVSSGSGTLRVRMCTFTATGLGTTCGSMRQIVPGGFPVVVVYPPGGLSSAQGAYFQVTFPSGQVSTVQQIIPVLSR